MRPHVAQVTYVPEGGPLPEDLPHRDLCVVEDSPFLLIRLRHPVNPTVGQLKLVQVRQVPAGKDKIDRHCKVLQCVVGTHQHETSGARIQIGPPP